MGKLVLTGGEVITPTEERFLDVTIEGNLVTGICTQSEAALAGAERLDVTECYVTPGLFDLQVNGSEPCNLWMDPEPAQVRALCQRMLKSGVTSLLPTLITDDLDHMSKNISFLESLGVGNGAEPVFGVRMPGLHLEGPCLSPQRPGVHPPDHLQPLSINVLERIITPSVRLVTVAPELDVSGAALAWLENKGITVSLGHSNATYDEARTAFDRGIRLITHTFNALPAIHHRAPGAVTAAFLDDRVWCCVICDGLHVHPAAVRLLLKVKGVERTVLVTDIAQIGTAGGGLVGSSIHLDEAVRNVVNWGAATFPEAIRMATLNAAAAVSLEDKLGRLAVGRNADICVWDKRTLAVKHVIANGQLLI